MVHYLILLQRMLTMMNHNLLVILERRMMMVLNINTISPSVTTAPLEATHADLFGDETEVDISNITTTYLVPSTLNTRIHKDHSLDLGIGRTQEGNPSSKRSKLDRLCKKSFCNLNYNRNKKDKRGIVVRNKARLVAQGYTQEDEIDYDEVFSPVARIKVIRLFLAYTSFKDFVVYKMDVKSAFLYGKIKEEVYVYQPLGFEDPEFPDRVYKVEKSLYGLHQAFRAWYETLSTYLLENRFHRGQIDKTLFIKRFKGDILLVQVYVDDIIFGSTRKDMCTEFEKMMHKKFQMSSMGELTFFLRLQVAQKDDGIFISRDKYVDEILNKFGFSTVKTTSTPMETSKPLLKDAEAEDVDCLDSSFLLLEYSVSAGKSSFLLVSYSCWQSMIGSLMYLTASRHGIMFVVCVCARFQVTPKVLHLHAVKRIFKYLKGQPKLGLWYPKESPFELEAYTDSDYGGASIDMKYIIGGCQFLRSRLISWQCKKQLWLPTLLLKQTNKAVSTGVDVRHRGAATTITSLDARQDSGNIDKTPSMLHDLPLLRGHTLRSDEGRMQHNELMDLVTKLSDRVAALETDLEQTKKVFGAAYTKLIQKVKRGSFQTGEEISQINEDKGITLVQIGAQTQGRYGQDMEYDTSVFDTTTAEGVKTKRTKLQQEQERLGLEAAMRLQAKIDEEERRRITRVHETASSFNIKEWEDIQARVKADEELAPCKPNIQSLIRRFTLKIQESTRKSSWLVIIQRGNQVFEDVIETFDRDDLVKLWSLVQERFNSTELTEDKEREIWVELKRLFEPDADDELWKSQKHNHGDMAWRLYDTCGVHHVSTKDGVDIYMLVEREYPLSRSVLTLMLVVKLMVDHHSKMANELL
nr:putative ribonuclease H-like domain-containing protein [Tanacetum cinerariifolium]